MPMLPAEPYEENTRLRSLGLDAYPATTGDVLGETAEEAWTRNPTPSLLRELERATDTGVQDQRRVLDRIDRGGLFQTCN